MADYITNFQRNNLIKLAEFLETNYLNIRIDMTIFGNFYSENSNNTASCIASYGPRAGVAPISTDRNWIYYIRRCFGTVPFSSKEENGGLYRFLFHDNWVNIDNTALGGAARIRYFLDHEDTIEKYYDLFNPDLYKHYLKFQ